jgi:hypothetical protein
MSSDSIVGEYGMFNTHASSLAGTKPATQVRRLSQRTFWLLFVLEGLLIAGMLLFALSLLAPPRAPLAQSADYATVRAAIQSRLSGALADAPVEVAPGATVPATSVGGFALNGYTYYYYREGRTNLDPLSRGTLTRDQVELVSREALGRDIVVIYRVQSKERATD